MLNYDFREVLEKSLAKLKEWGGKKYPHFELLDYTEDGSGLIMTDFYEVYGP